MPGILEVVGMSDLMIEDWERGWHGSDKSICVHCVPDDYLRHVVARAVKDELACSFCGAAPAAVFDVFTEAFMVGVRNKFEQADNADMPWEGGYVFETYTHWDLPEMFDWEVQTGHEADVIDELRTCLEEKTYASRWWAETEPDEAYSSAWKEFREQILHRTRFVFWARKGTSEHYGAGEVSVSKILEAIGRLLVAFDLVPTLPAGTVTYRGRGHTRHEDSRDWGAAQLGTNLPENATSSSRMSPAGIPLFYGADDVDTALIEVAHADDREFFTVGKFVTTEPATVVDLTQVPPVPSVFDPERGGYQGQLRFLNELVDELRKPIDTARSNLDYVPTQVFCEYFLHVFDPGADADKDATAEAGVEAKTKVRGLMWTSSVARGRSGCLALNVPQEDCVDVADATTGRVQLHLVPGSTTVHRRRTDEFREL
jgi:hypothetical protein